MKVSKKGAGLLLVCMLLLAVPGFAGSDALLVEGEMAAAVTVYSTMRFKGVKGTRNLSYVMYIPPSFSQTLNTQMISDFVKNVTPAPEEAREFSDEFGNIGIRFKWNREISNVHIGVQYKTTLISNYPELSSNAPFPTVLEDDLKVFLSSTPSSPANDVYINYIGRSLAQNLHKEIDVVNSIFAWLDKNISVSDSEASALHYSAQAVLKRREGNSKGISNLLAAFCKGLGIPARVVYGISYQKEISIPTADDTYVFDLYNGERYWVEVFLPDIGWVQYDPAGFHFGNTTRSIKLAAGPDSEAASEKWSVESGKVNLDKEYIFDIKDDELKTTLRKIESRETEKIILSPALTGVELYRIEPDLNIDALKREYAAPELSEGKPGPVLQNSDLSNSVGVVATTTRIYAQKFELLSPLVVAELRLPLVKFSDSGKIWVEIYGDAGGVPGAMLYRSQSTDSTRLRFMMISNPWVTFSFGNQQAKLASGAYWFSLRSSGSCIFNWFAKEGNAFGTANDTRFTEAKLKTPRWNSVANYDMGFQIIGTRLQE